MRVGEDDGKPESLNPFSQREVYVRDVHQHRPGRTPHDLQPLTLPPRA